MGVKINATVDSKLNESRPAKCVSWAIDNRKKCCLGIIPHHNPVCNICLHMFSVKQDFVSHAQILVSHCFIDLSRYMTFVHCICSSASFKNLLESTFPWILYIGNNYCKKSSVAWPTLYNVEYALVLKVKERYQETDLTGVFE